MKKRNPATKHKGIFSFTTAKKARLTGRAYIRLGGEQQLCFGKSKVRFGKGLIYTTLPELQRNCIELLFPRYQLNRRY
jgi:hypothetical protein